MTLKQGCFIFNTGLVQSTVTRSPSGDASRTGNLRHCKQEIEDLKPCAAGQWAFWESVRVQRVETCIQTHTKDPQKGNKPPASCLDIITEKSIHCKPVCATDLNSMQIVWVTEGRDLQWPLQSKHRHQNHTHTPSSSPQNTDVWSWYLLTLAYIHVRM